MPQGFILWLIEHETTLALLPHVQEVVSEQFELSAKPLVFALELTDVPFDLLKGRSLEAVQLEFEDLHPQLHFSVDRCWC